MILNALFEEFASNAVFERYLKFLEKALPWTPRRLYQVGPDHELVARCATDTTHIHESFELKLIYKGSLIARFPKGELLLKAPSLLLIHPYTAHEADNASSRDEKCLDTVFAFDQHQIEFCVNRKHEEFATLLDKKTLKNWRSRLHTHPCDILQNISRSMTSQEDVLESQALSSWLNLFTTTLLTSMARSSRNPGEKSDLVDIACHYVHKHYHDSKLSAKSIASHVGLSPEHLSRLFTDKTGKPLRKYLIDHRLQRAQDFLRSSAYSVKEVAYLTGWKSPFYFSRVYTQNFGTPPSRQSP